MSTAAIKLDTYDKARSQLLIRQPFFASVVLSTEWIPDEKIPTACTDMVKVWYNPKFIDDLGVDHAMFVLVHEIMHIILKHGLRRGSRKPIRWNKACDYAINQELVDSGLSMPDSGLIDKAKYGGMTAEQIYDILTQEKEQGGGKGKGKPPPGTKVQPGQPGDRPDDDDDVTDLGEMGADVMTPGERDGNEPTEAEARQISAGIDGKVAQAATMARAAGKLPANIALLVDGVLNPPQPWEIVLREFMTRMVQQNETWSRRNRRFTPILPTSFDVGMGELVIIGDTSGSMMVDKIFAQIAVEINHCREYVKPERTRVVWADYAECSHEQVFEPDEQVVLEPKGGGGTDMRLPLRYVEKFHPDVVILITDCETPWPSQETPYPLIVASTTNQKCPDWALRLQLRTHA
jgi:predicted metal-dependent peptidase